jgi:hypothetical protein
MIYILKLIKIINCKKKEIFFEFKIKKKMLVAKIILQLFLCYTRDQTQGLIPGHTQASQALPHWVTPAAQYVTV